MLQFCPTGGRLNVQDRAVLGYMRGREMGRRQIGGCRRSPHRPEVMCNVLGQTANIYLDVAVSPTTSRHCAAVILTDVVALAQMLVDPGNIGCYRLAAGPRRCV